MLYISTFSNILVMSLLIVLSFLFFKDVMLFTDFDGQLTDFSRNAEATFQRTVFKNRLRPDSSFTAQDLYS